MSKYGKWLLAAFIALPQILHAECSKLQVSGNAEYPPYLWRSDENSRLLVGAVSLLVDRMAKETGIQMQVEFIGPWGRAQEEIAAGRVDILAGAFRTTARTERMDYLYPPFLLTRTSVWVNQRKSFEFNGLVDLKGRQGVTVTNNSFGQEFDDYARDNLKIYQVGTLEQGFRMLEDQRVDYVVYEDAPGKAYATRLKTENITTLERPVSGEYLYFTMSKLSACNKPEVRDKIEAVLKRATEEGWMDGYLKIAEQMWIDRK